MMKTITLEQIDFEKVDTLLEGFNKSTGFVTAILDLDGNVLSKSGWRQICTEFHRIHPETSKKCTISDTVLANKMEEGEKYHFYQCLNGLVDVAVPIVIKGEHIANLFSGQFFFEEPDSSFFSKKAEKHGFNQEIYLKALKKVPVVSKEKVLTAMNFLLNMTHMISDMTFQKMEQMELNEALIESENKFRTFIMASSDSVYRMSPDWNVMYELDGRGFIVDTVKANAGWFQEYIPPDDQENVMSVIQEAIRTRSLFELEHRVWRVDGSFGWTFSRAIPRLNANGEIFEWFGAASDVTERKQAEEKIKENYALLRIAGEKAKLGGWSVNLAENRSYWSDQVATIHEMPIGYSPLVEDGINFYAPEWRDKITEVFTRCVQEEIPYDEEMEIITSTGKRVWVRTIGEAVRDDKGKVVKVQGAFQDITERKLAEETLRLERSNLNSVLENMQSGVFFFDQKGENCWMNPEALRIHGFSSAFDMLERFSQYTQEWELMDPTGRVLPIEEWPGSRAFRGERYQNYEIRLRHLKSGRTSDVLYSCAEVRDISGNIERLVFTILDITERKEAEDKIHEQLNELRRWFEITLDREGRVLELKQEVNELLKQCGEASRYESAIPDDPDATIIS